MSVYLLNPVLKANNISKDDSDFEKLRKLGDNTGNMVFVNAVKEQLSFDKEEWLQEGMDADDDSTYILPCSNFLHVSNRWLEPLVDILEKKSIKIVMIGLGAQAELNAPPQSVIRQLSKKQKRFFEIVSERCSSIGVRGEFTAACLAEMGIKNSKVIGCPSIYKYLDGEFPIMAEPSLEKVLVTITPSKDEASKILQMGMKNGFNWVMQSKDEVTSLYSNNSVVKAIQKAVRFPGIKWSDIESYQKNYAQIFWDFEEWNKYMQEEQFTFAFGTRFHGNMMALRNSIPALWIIHDMRTWELVNTLKVPGIVKRNIDFPEKIIEKCDYSEFYKSYKGNVENYLSFLEENGVKR